MKCACCGADIPSGSTICEYCDSAVEIVASNGRTWSFEHVKRSHEYARRNSPERLAAVPGLPALMTVIPVIFFGMFITFSVVFTLTAWGMGGVAICSVGLVGLVPLGMSLVSVGFVVLGIFLLASTLKKARQYKEAPLKADAAVIIGKRTALSGRSSNRSASTFFYVTAEFEDGCRKEFQPARADLYGRLVEGDVGVLFHRSDMALDFDRVPLES